MLDIYCLPALVSTFYGDRLCNHAMVIFLMC
jgi:hypothetical protein